MRRQCSLNFSASGPRRLAPVVGNIECRQEEFDNEEVSDGRPLLVPFDTIKRWTTRHFEQSFSADGGQTWELNWVATDTRS